MTLVNYQTFLTFSKLRHLTVSGYLRIFVMDFDYNKYVIAH